jgi:hypothetical protein
MKNIAWCGLEHSQRSWVYPISPARPQNGVPTQAGFFLQSIESDLLQPLPQGLFSRTGILLVSHERRQLRASLILMAMEY